MRSNITPGAIFPNFELCDHTAQRRNLAELQGPFPMVVVLSRGAIHPNRRGGADGFGEVPRDVRAAYCRVVTISTNQSILTNEHRSEPDLDIAEYSDPINSPMVSRVVVLEPRLVIYRIYDGFWYLGMPTLDGLRRDLRAVIRKYRADRDITTMELGAAWQQSREAPFYPYGEAYTEALCELQ